MKRRNKVTRHLFAALLMFSMMLSMLTPLHKVYASDEVVVKLHYHRADGAYEGWDVWFWEYGKDGAGFAFEDENGEKVATITLTPGTAQLGFIVRTADWTKDIDKDQFIDVSEMVSGTVHVYVESKVEGFEKVYGEDAVKGIKVTNAKYEGGNVVTITLTDNCDGDPATAFTFTGDKGVIGIQSASGNGKGVYTVFLDESLDYFKSYKVTFMDIEYNVVIPSIWSEVFFEEEMTYTGNDLGATWTKEKTTFKVWAPTATKLEVYLYENGTPYVDDKIDTIPMTKDVNGTWVCTKDGDISGKYYVYSVTVNGRQTTVCDPYAKSTGVNGNRAMVIDLDSTDPEGWENDKDPNYNLNPTDMIIYELQIRDLGAHESSGITNVGKFLSLTETGTTTKAGIPTGLDHIKELGITHLHILPFYDFGSVDETKQINQYNWGYDPVNFNVPEGSYSTDAYHGEVRVKEAKQMIQALHNNGISVIMDVVYNHVQSAESFCFNKLVPGYFSRTNDLGSYSNGSGCGNDTASERSMVRKYIVDSVNYWVNEYHIDGFRFDLVGLLDVDTINEIVNTVHEKHPNVKFYGEGWTLTTSVTKKNVQLATQTNSALTPDFAYFSDNIRDALKGGVFSTTSTGFVSGSSNAGTIMKLFKAQTAWTKNPSQTINYASCHDNNTLIDRITSSTPSATREERVKMNNLAAAIYLTAEGIPFMQAGEEMLRSKVNADGTFNSNSYNAGDSVNALVWANLEEKEYADTYNYYKGLIAFRKAHPALRLSDAASVEAKVTNLEGLEGNTAALLIDGSVEGEDADRICCIFNGNSTTTDVTLPDGEWKVCVDGKTAGVKYFKTVSGTVTVDAVSALILVQGDRIEASPEDKSNEDNQSTATENAEAIENSENNGSGNEKSNKTLPIVLGCSGAVIVLAVIAILLFRKKK